MLNKITDCTNEKNYQKYDADLSNGGKINTTRKPRENIVGNFLNFARTND